MVSKNLALLLGLTACSDSNDSSKTLYSPNVELTVQSVSSNYAAPMEILVQKNSDLYGKKALVLYETKDGPSLGQYIVGKPIDGELVSKVEDALSIEGAYSRRGGVFRPQSMSSDESPYRLSINSEFGPRRGTADVIIIADRKGFVVDGKFDYNGIDRHRGQVYGLFPEGVGNFKIEKLGEGRK